MKLTLFAFVLILFTHTVGVDSYGIVRWRRFSPELIQALTEATQPGTQIAFLDEATRPEAVADLWNTKQSNTVVRLVEPWVWVGTGEIVFNIEVGEWVIDIPPHIDYLYLDPRESWGRQGVAWCLQEAWIETVYEDEEWWLGRINKEAVN